MSLPYKWFSGKGGWINQLVQKLPENIRNKVRATFLFRPDDVNDLNPFPPARMDYPGVDRIKGYRYPAPGSRGPANVPVSESDDKIYDIKYYDRDTRRKRMPILFEWAPAYKRIEAPPSPEPARPMGSPGNKNPAVLAYDPTGLRSAMSATNEELEKALEKEMPNHLPKAEWWDDQESIIEDCKKKGLPVPVGRRPRFQIPAMARQARW